MQNQQQPYSAIGHPYAAAASAAAAAAASYAPPAPAAAAASSSSSSVLVEVEVSRNHASQGKLSRSQLESKLRDWLLILPRLVSGEMDAPPALRSALLTIRLEVVGAPGPDGVWHSSPDGVAPKEADMQFYIYVLAEDDLQAEELYMDEADENEAPVTAGHSCSLPNARMGALWPNLFYPYAEKTTVLSYAEMALEMAQHGVPAEVISCNRIVLLHGPPGTGKTSLCQAIAQKLAIRLHDTYPHARFMEINSHSLFSKWFSESGKLVQKLFERVQQQLEDEPQLFFCILIDEVESLASSRSSGGSDPQDAVRAGNAVLTQLDRLRRYPNVLFLCTSNLTEMIDSAFVDRIDIKQFIGPPNLEARYEILRSQVEALLRPAGAAAKPMLINDCGVALPLLSYQRLRAAMASEAAMHSMRSQSAPTLLVCQQMEQIALQCESVGGRLLRRAPLACLSDWRQANRGRSAPISLSQFLARMPVTMQRERAAADRMHDPSGGADGHATFVTSGSGSSSLVNGHSSTSNLPSTGVGSIKPEADNCMQ